MQFLIGQKRAGGRTGLLYCGDAGSEARVRDALADALMGPGGVVMLLCCSKMGFCVVSCVFLEFMRLGRTR